MNEADDRLAGVEQRLDDIAGDVQVLKDDVQVLKNDVRGLRVLSEHHDEKIQKIAEVQAHHGRKLDEHGRLLQDIRDQLAPLRDMRDFVQRVAENHEQRIAALEERNRS